jgi:hypothetical protein
VASALKKRNKAAGEGQRSLETLWTNAGEAETAELTSAVAALDAAPDVDAVGLKAKEIRWEEIRASKAYRHQRFVADAWCAAFVWPKLSGPLADAAPTNELWRQIRDGQGEPPALTMKTTEQLAMLHRFFHWNLAFPQVYAKGGFDVVLGNPPWEHVEIKEQEWFAERSPEIANAANASMRKKMIEGLRENDPPMHAAFLRDLRRVAGENQLVRESGRFPLCARGRINTYSLFAEHNRAITSLSGRAAFIVPGGIAMDDTTKEFFQAIVSSGSLASLYHFENEDRVFPGIHHASRFVLLTIDRSGRAGIADLVFYARQVGDLDETNRHVALRPMDFELLNPNSRTCPTFRSRRDADINLAMYARAGVLWRDNQLDGIHGTCDSCRVSSTWHQTSRLFRTRSEVEAGVRA